MRKQAAYLLSRVRSIPLKLWLLTISLQLSIATPWSVLDTWLKEDDTKILSRLSLVEWVMSTFAEALIVLLLFQHLSGLEIQLNKAITLVWRRTGALITWALLNNFVALAGFFLLILPSLWWFTVTWIVLPVLLVEEENLMTALRQSVRRMRGQRLIALLLSTIWLALALFAHAASENIGDSLYLLDELLGLLSGSLLAATSVVLYLQTDAGRAKAPIPP